MGLLYHIVYGLYIVLWIFFVFVVWLGCARLRHRLVKVDAVGDLVGLGALTFGIALGCGCGWNGWSALAFGFAWSVGCGWLMWVLGRFALVFAIAWGVRRLFEAVEGGRF